MKYLGYKYAFNFNASHYFENPENLHLHTFNLTIYITHKTEKQQIFIYDNTERIIQDFISKFQDKCFNDIPPFDKISPTLENISNYFTEQITDILKDKGIELNSLEFSDSTKHTYCLSDNKPSEVAEQNIERIKNDLKFNKPTAKIKTKTPISAKTIKDIPKVLRPIYEETLDNSAPLPMYYVFFGLGILIVLGVILTILIAKSGLYPIGLDVHGHLFKTDIIYQGIKEGNFYPLYTPYWYNGLQPFRYWPPMCYYFMALLQAIAGGNVMSAYLLFIFSSFVIGGLGWLLFANKLKRPYLGIFMSIVWFFFPDNLRVFFGEGNMPRMFITMLLPILFYFIWCFVQYRQKYAIFPTIIFMIICVFSHLMISAMIGVGTFVFLLIYSITNKRFKESIQVILSLLFSFAVCGIWVYPALKGGIISMDASGNQDLMASLAGRLVDTLNPLIRYTKGVTELYIGLSVAMIALIGLFFSNKRSTAGFLSIIIVILGTTTAVTPLLQKLPLSQLFWIRRFLPIAYTMFIIGIFEWKKIKKPLLIGMCVLIVADCIPTFNLREFDYKMNSPATEPVIQHTMDDLLITQAKDVTKSRVCAMDLSMLGPMPSYAFGTLESKTPYVFGWAWQGASTAMNISNLNEAMEAKNYNYVFDRNLELGADSVIIDKSMIHESEDYISLNNSAKKLGYNLIGNSERTLLYHLDVDSQFGVITDYSSIAIGSNAAITKMVFPSFRTGDKIYIDDYSIQELSAFKNIYLSGFFYKNKKDAEALIETVATNGVKIFIDMNNVPVDPLTNRMTFLDVSAQPITFTGRFPELITNDKVYKAKLFDKQYNVWNSVYVTGLKKVEGSFWFNDSKLDFLGKGDNDNITFIGLNILFHAYTSQDQELSDLILKTTNCKCEELPKRQIVPIDIKYEKNKIIINSDYDNVNTTLAWQDTFESNQQISPQLNLLMVNKGTTVITMKYPYLAKSITVSIIGIILEAAIIFWVFHSKNKKIN